MAAFRRVEDARAGATAVGILVPPGVRTFVIVRPRGVKWDLLPTLADAESPSFCHFERDEAAGVARKVLRSLQSLAEANERLQAGVRQVSNGLHVWMRLLGFDWLLCPRTPGAAYQPLLFAESEIAQDALSAVLPFLQPAQDGEQEYYFNTQNFARG